MSEGRRQIRLLDECSGDISSVDGFLLFHPVAGELIYDPFDVEGFFLRKHKHWIHASSGIPCL
jgi:hypothetical protein